MDLPCHGLLIVVVLLQMDALLSGYVSGRAGSLHQVLSEFSIVHPIRTDSKGRVLAATVSAHQRNKRHAPSPTAPPTDSATDVLHQAPPTPTSSHRRRRRSNEAADGDELFYNVTVFGQDLHLRLRPNARLIAPTATMEWEESGHLRSEPIRDAGCFYTGTVSNMEDTSVAISNCNGLAGMIRTGKDEFFIEPLERLRPGEEEGRGQHVVYRSSAVIRKQSHVNQAKAANQSTDDFLRGPLLGSLNLTQNPVPSGPRSARRRRYLAEAELFNIEVLLAVDYSVLLFHGRDHIQKYLLTLMNIVNEIYQDHSLGANINMVLVRIIMLSPAKSQELICVGNPQKSLENVCGWSYHQQREQSHAEQHDHTIYLTRQEFGPSGMQGYAPVTGICRLHRSCVLVLEDGFSSAFVAAHETGHVLGMEHDGEANDCADDVPLGSIMSPRVQATFYRYHWSRCSWRELHKYLQTYDCLRDDPFNHEWPAQPQLPGFQYSMDQQCRFDFGPGYSLCTAYTTPDLCKQLWCSDYQNPFFCKTKKGPPLDGTKCGPGKHCFKGFCMKLTPNLLRQDGSWGAWSPFGSCSRTCGGGVQFRTRRCDNPPPANGGRTCFGNSYEFQLCSTEDCPPLTDFREDQCKVWNPVFEHEGLKHHWLPYQHPDPDERCRLYCQSRETGAVASMNRMVHDGTACSYDDAHSVCVRGECEHVGCDGQIASDQQEDRCGVCGGDDSSCKVVRGNFTRSTKKDGYLKILEIPKGARELLVQEFKETPHILAARNQDTGRVFLNEEDRLAEPRVLVEKGVVWLYNRSGERDVLQAAGPLKYAVLLMVRSHGDAKVTVSYKYIIQDRLRSELESNLVQEDAVFYEWALKKWSHCSKPCGGGRQYTRFGCRRKADGKMVQRLFCTNINKPRAISRKCNAETCRPPRWVSRDWEACSASCGQSGWQRRWVGCQQESSSGKQQRSVSSRLCSAPRPESRRTCNRRPCPPAWRTGPWTPCSASCGNGTQERQVACLNPEGSAGNCSDPQPITTRACHAPPCTGDQKNAIILWLSRSNPNFPAAHNSSRQRCRGDRSVFCRMEVLSRYCAISGYRQMCCKSCSERKFSNTTSNFNSSTSSANSTSTTSSNNSTNTTSSPGSTSCTSSSVFSSFSTVTDSSSSGKLTATSATTTPVSNGAHVLGDVIAEAPPTVPQTPPPTSRTSTDFVYVDYDDYEEYSSYGDPSLLSELSVTVTTVKAAVAMTTSATVTTSATAAATSLTQTAPPLSFRRTTPTMVVVPMATDNQTAAPVPEFPADDIISATSAAVPRTEPGPPAPLPRKENNSVDEVQYGVVGMDGDAGRDQQNYFVPRMQQRMPPLRERTQNQRIQQLLREKRVQSLLSRINRTRVSRASRER